MRHLPAALSLLGGALVAASALRGPAADLDVARSVSRALQDTSERVAEGVVRIGALGPSRMPLGQGSGVVIDVENFGPTIVTNAHVVAGATRIDVTFVDGSTVSAQVLGVDTESDLAALRVEREGLRAVPLRSQGEPRVGESVLAVGNPLGLGHSVTSGIISAVGRSEALGLRLTYQGFLQTDAAINPGNSGGPLVDLEGRIVGINTAVADPRAGGQGIGFAIPAERVEFVVPQLARYGEVSRGYLGVQLDDISLDEARRAGHQGPARARISRVEVDTPAADAGLKRGDLILAIDTEPIDSVSELFDVVAGIPPGREARIEVLRNRKTLVVPVTLARRE